MSYWERTLSDTFTDGDGRMFVIDDLSVTIFEWASSTSRGVQAMRVPIASVLRAADEARARSGVIDDSWEQVDALRDAAEAMLDRLVAHRTPRAAT